MILGIYALALALIHILANRFRFLAMVPRSRWLSAAGGVAVSYIFIHVFPELNQMQLVVKEHLKEKNLSFLDNHVYLISLFGLTVFYGLERLSRTSRKGNKAKGNGEHTSPKVFWIHILSFAIYNALVGYLLVTGARSELGHFLFFFAMAVHFLTNDYGLWYDHKEMYAEKGRWLLSVGVLLGWALGVVVSLREIWIAILFSFLAGGTIMNVLKEELPEDRKSNFTAFVFGVVGYAVLLLSI